MQVNMLIAAIGIEKQQLRLHCLSGDELAARSPDGCQHWYRRVADERADISRLAFEYACEDDPSDRLLVTFGTLPGHKVKAILALRNKCGIETAERRWSPIISQVGRVPHVGTVTGNAVVFFPKGEKIFAARRPVHPSHFIDRLMMRERAAVGEEMERLLADQPKGVALRGV